ncbi:MAG TPA: hypothetical protein PKD76_02580 [Solirubrobacterales bacterium]|nr:hypothetical protein [Solirubrobacterales bacterium]
MTSVEEIFAEYVFAERDGKGDPRPFLKRVPAGDRERLEELIDSYLASAPGRRWDPSAFAGSEEERLVESLSRALNGVSGTWPVVLPGLRERARIKRSELVDRLAGTLGVPGQREAVDEYYHGMEYGTLESSGVSDKVLDALGEILGSGRDALKNSGELMGDGATARGDAVFAREVPHIAVPFEVADRDGEKAGFNSPAGENEPDDPEREKVDRMFTGGN